jgi:6-phosphogluconolactonase/glucosamine-6-phosphate isomerase/deaminase
MDHVKQLLLERNLLSHHNRGILIVNSSPTDAVSFVKELFYRSVDGKTLLLLSGGKTPKDLYAEFTGDEKLLPGAVGQIDERYGAPHHENSNQKMMEGTGFLRYLQMRDIPFYPILKGESQKDTAMRYDATLRDLYSVYHRSIGIMGIGADGHTAGIPASKSVWKEFAIANRGRTEYVIDYDDHGVFYNERVTMTFAGLSMLDLLVALVFGDDKRIALNLMLEEGEEDEIPARFYTRPDIAKKTLIITDQQI